MGFSTSVNVRGHSVIEYIAVDYLCCSSVNTFNVLMHTHYSHSPI